MVAMRKDTHPGTLGTAGTSSGTGAATSGLAQDEQPWEPQADALGLSVGVEDMLMLPFETL
jgi:hypothetical protein